MSFAIAAAGTGGHVYPGLAVGEALVAGGVPRSEVLFVGGDRLEASVYPRAGFPFLSVPLRGLERRLAVSNLGLPAVVVRATRTIADELGRRRVGALLGMGSYVTVPAAFAARRVGARVAISEQNAEAGLANRLASRLAVRVFGSFPGTAGLSRAEWVGNPVRPEIAHFDRAALREFALARYGLDPAVTVVGVFGGSLGAGVVNAAAAELVAGWSGPPIQVVQLAGEEKAPALQGSASRASLRWVVVGFEERMDAFYAASDLVIARAGGAIAELAATGTPAILVPGRFGSGSHQHANAAAYSAAGAAVELGEERLAELPGVVADLVARPERLSAMAAAARLVARPEAAATIAAALVEVHDAR